MKEFRDLIARDSLTMVDFYATWCGPCKAMHPVVDELAGKYSGRIDVLKLDIDAPQNHDITRQYRISSVPTIIFFRKGEVVWRGSGAVGADYLKGVIEKLEQRQEA